MEKKTEQILKNIRDESRNIDITNKEKLDKNQSLKLSKDEFKTDFLNSAYVKSISINNEKNTASLNLYNGYVMAIMGNIYKANFSDIKNNLKTTSEMIVFNRMVGSELKNNSKPFIDSLNKEV